MSKTIKITFIITILVELIFIILAYSHVGLERLPIQLLRLFIQVLLFTGILLQNFKHATILLTSYHVFTAILAYNQGFETPFIILLGYHFVIGTAIYFHKWIDINVFKT